MEEVSGLSSKKELLSIYKTATEDEYAFLYVNLAARNVHEMFFKNFSARIVLEDVSDDWYFNLTTIISTISRHSINEKATIDYCISRRSAPDIEHGAGYVINRANEESIA